MTNRNPKADPLIDGILTTTASGFFSTIGHTAAWCGNTLFTSQFTNPLTSIAVPALRASLAGLSVSSLHMLYRYAIDDDSEVDIMTQLLMSLSAGALAAAVSGNMEDVLPELLASGFGIAALITLTLVTSDNEDELESKESNAPKMA